MTADEKHPEDSSSQSRSLTVAESAVPWWTVSCVCFLGVISEGLASSLLLYHPHDFVIA